MLPRLQRCSASDAAQPPMLLRCRGSPATHRRLSPGAERPTTNRRTVRRGSPDTLGSRPSGVKPKAGANHAAGPAKAEVRVLVPAETIAARYKPRSPRRTTLERCHVRPASTIRAASAKRARCYEPRAQSERAFAMTSRVPCPPASTIRAASAKRADAPTAEPSTSRDRPPLPRSVTRVSKRVLQPPLPPGEGRGEGNPRRPCRRLRPPTTRHRHERQADRYADAVRVCH